MIEIKSRKIAVLGLNDDGLEMVKALSKAGAYVSGFGTATPSQEKAIQEKFQAIPCQLLWREIPENALTQFDLIIDTPGGGNYIAARDFAKKNGVRVLSDLDLAIEFMQAPIIAVTGTNGKSTTVALINEMLNQQGYKVVTVGGDFSPWGERILDKKKYDYYVLETNSRRLEISSSLHPHIAVLLNLYPAHGDRHKGGVPAYIEAKAKIFANQTEADYLVHEGTSENLHELIRLKSPKSKPVMFVLDNFVGPPGAYRSGQNLIWLGLSNENETYSLRKVKSRLPTYIMDLLAALVVARLCKVEPRHIQSVIDNFKGLPSRMEAIRTVGNVTFIDDARSTNIGATSWALSSYTRPIIWIAGGGLVDGSRLRDLPHIIKGGVKLIILIGSERKTLLRALGGIAPTIEAADLKEAVEVAHKMAEPKDVVIFSPLCPPDYKTQKPGKFRGSEFKKLVERLPEIPRVIRTKIQFTKI
jgi:UDP-N-acetylmuramoylalanine--D-glutamate ligase